MRLTVFLVTKGREKFLDEILDSFENLFKYDVDFLILDNGAPKSIGMRLKSWQQKSPDRIKLVRFDDNDSRHSTQWDVIRKNNVDWIVCPSDDDVIRMEIIANWEAALIENPNMVGFASSAAIMSENGKLTGEVFRPSSSNFSSSTDRIAAGFYEPPFHWPCLFMRVSKLPVHTPPSRYAYDWWLGLQLLIAGEVVTSNSIGINYRVHPQQESFLAPLRRKYFEAHIWIDRLANSKEFLGWAKALNDSERIRFWDQLLTSPPIYGDSDFSRPILNSIFRTLMESCNDAETAMIIANKYAFSAGVLIKNGEVKNLISQLPPLEEITKGNVNFVSALNACQKIRSVCQYFSYAVEGQNYLISCMHSYKSNDAILIECEKLYDNMDEINSDLVISQVTEYLENNGKIRFIITSGEKLIIKTFRKFKDRIPKALRDYLRILKSKAIKLSG